MTSDRIIPIPSALSLSKLVLNGCSRRNGRSTLDDDTDLEVRLKRLTADILRHATTPEAERKAERFANAAVEMLMRGTAAW